MSDRIETEAVPAEFAWLKPGVPVLYESSPGRRFAAMVDSDPRPLGGGTWVVHLSGLGDDYRAWTKRQRHTVPAAACHCLSPLPAPAPPEPSGGPIKPRTTELEALDIMQRLLVTRAPATAQVDVEALISVVRRAMWRDGVDLAEQSVEKTIRAYFAPLLAGTPALRRPAPATAQVDIGELRTAVEALYDLACREGRSEVVSGIGGVLKLMDARGYFATPASPPASEGEKS